MSGSFTLPLFFFVRLFSLLTPKHVVFSSQPFSLSLCNFSHSPWKFDFLLWGLNENKKKNNNYLCNLLLPKSPPVIKASIFNLIWTQENRLFKKKSKMKHLRNKPGNVKLPNLKQRYLFKMFMVNFYDYTCLHLEVKFMILLYFLKCFFFF